MQQTSSPPSKLLNGRSVLAVAGILALLTFGLYGWLIPTYYVGSDDYLELERALTVDSKDPKQVFTTTHFGTAKYRPLDRLLNLVTATVGDGGAMAFRARNVAFHFVNSLLVYLVAYYLTGRKRAALLCASVFAVHHVANLAIVFAVSTKVLLTTFVLLGLLCALFASDGRRFMTVAYGAGAVLFALLAVFSHESALLFPLVLAALVWIRTRRSNRRLGMALAAAMLIPIVVFSVARLTVPARSEGGFALSDPALAAKSVLYYAADMVSPVDFVMFPEFFHRADDVIANVVGKSKTGYMIAGAIVLIFAAVAGVVVLSSRLRRITVSVLRRLWADPVSLLMLAMIGTFLLPLVATVRPSEIYLYLPSAFYPILLVRLLALLVGPRVPFMAALLGAALLLAFGTFSAVRNLEIRREGAIAEAITKQLRTLQPAARVGSHLLFANEEKRERISVAIYWLEGVEVFEPQGIPSAVRILYDDPGLTAEIVPYSGLKDSVRQGAAPVAAFVWAGPPDSRLSEFR